jgi:large subunit ribosomal protein L9
MKVVLRSDVEGVGRRGDIVSVAGGFARNFLLPHGRAIVATKGVTDQAAAMRRARDLKEARDRESAQAQATILAGALITITARAGASGRLFGSVSATDVAAAVREQKGVEIERRHIELAEPIKSVGKHDLPVVLFGDVATVITVDVVGGD